MGLLSTPTVRDDKVVFRQDFTSRQYVQDAGGVLVNCNVGLRGPGLISTASSARITYDRTQSTLINANKMTIRVRFKTSSTLASAVLLSKYDTIGTWAFGIDWFGALLVAYMGSSANYSYPTASFLASTEYTAHFVYDGSLAAASRGIWYVAGVPVAITLGGTIPTTIPSTNIPITIFNKYGVATSAPPSSFTLFDVCIWRVALSATEVADDAADRTFTP